MMPAALHEALVDQRAMQLIRVLGAPITGARAARDREVTLARAHVGRWWRCTLRLWGARAVLVFFAAALVVGWLLARIGLGDVTRRLSKRVLRALGRDPGLIP